MKNFIDRAHELAKTITEIRSNLVPANWHCYSNTEDEYQAQARSIVDVELKMKLLFLDADKGQGKLFVDYHERYLGLLRLSFKYSLDRRIQTLEGCKHLLGLFVNWISSRNNTIAN